MKRLFVTFAILGFTFFALAAKKGERDIQLPVNVIFTEGKTDLEGLMIEVNARGNFELDSGTEIASLEALEAFLISKKSTFAPRLIISSDSDDIEYYHKATKALLLFKKQCSQYSCVIENNSIASGK